MTGGLFKNGPRSSAFRETLGNTRFYTPQKILLDRHVGLFDE